MLTELRIENFAIIQRLELELGSGLITFTGETGAGKSIILDAIEALVGGRTDFNQIRSGAERAILEASFRVPESSRATILEILEREDLLDDPNYLTLGRELRREGRSTARVNGRAVSVGLLRELGGFLVDIHGQSEHLSLLNVRHHRVLLDHYASLQGVLNSYRENYRLLLGLRRELADLRRSEQDSARRAELLAFQVEEIQSAALHPGEEETLRQERDRLANAESLASLAQRALALLDEENPETPTLTDQMGQTAQALSNLSRIDASQGKMHEQALALAESLSDLSRDLRAYLERVEFNPRRLEQAEERLGLLHTLKRKYGGSLDAVLAYAVEAQQKLEQITHASERIAELEAEEKLLLEKLGEQARELSQLRRKAALGMSAAVESELADLQMSGAGFQVDLRSLPDPNGLRAGEQTVAFDENGVDQVEFLIAPNPGEGYKAMIKIASGGETSRIMLALKNVLARADAIPTLIFDEIDQGIGGRVGMVVGEKLWHLARQHQVLCVTHLPQLAAFGDQHLRVGKEVLEGRTLTQVEELAGALRLDELAQMLGGVSEANRQAAQETLNLARQRTAELTAPR